MILGWAKKDQQEVISLEEYIREFEPSDLSSNSVAFDIQKLNWLNGVYIRKLSIEQLKTHILPFVSTNFPLEKLEEVLPLIQERLVTLADFDQLTKFFYTTPNYEPTSLLQKNVSKELVIEELKATIDSIQSLTIWSLPHLEKAIRNLQEKNDWHKGQFFMMLRIAATGEKATPPLFATMIVLGQDLLITRLQEALNKLV